LIIDNDTNVVYLADTLPVRFPYFSNSFADALVKQGIEFHYLADTKDIWAVDYMPIQILPDQFVSFQYHPDYLMRSKPAKKTITNTDDICKKLGINVRKSDIILDGGNVIRWKDKVIMTDKIFRENPAYSPNRLLYLLSDQLGLDQIILVPQAPYDEIGHADGMVRFLDANTVLLNNYSKETKRHQNAIKKALSSAGLSMETIPYNPYQNQNDLQATGIYINYLQMHNALFIPVYGMKEDETVVQRLESVFPNLSIIPIRSEDIAIEGGVLNCISWNILSS
jgi:agmatine deiminase